MLTELHRFNPNYLTLRQQTASEFNAFQNIQKLLANQELGTLEEPKNRYQYQFGQ